jgi:hypothetical protein
MPSSRRPGDLMSATRRGRHRSALSRVASTASLATLISGHKAVTGLRQVDGFLAPSARSRVSCNGRARPSVPRGRGSRERAAADGIRASRLVRGPDRATGPALVGRDTMGPADARRTEVVAAAPPGTDRARQPGRAGHCHRGDRQHERKRQAGRQRFRHRRAHRHGNTQPGADAPGDEYEDKAKESPGHRAGDHPGACGNHPGTRGDRFRRLRQRPLHLRTATRRATKAPAANPANTGAMPTMGHQG